ncbi:ABC transporter substrate-binding protein [Brevibacillus daliensis]|uniref:ABC transporter substrate-binding protein n=1 Tax=Brevibacillus daliensis TaxID=2892995 RepID=UPI001E422980|nr:ABC transporter substrate-binding protein [Brevibacillus daliensis]
MMLLLEDYYRIRYPYQDVPLHLGMTISISQLAQLLCCTERNAKLIIRKLEDQGVIKWVPGRGRGNRSQLIFLVELEDIYHKTAKGLVYQGKIKEALALHHTYKNTLPHAYEQFQNWFDTQFGYQQEMCKNKPHVTLRLRFDDVFTEMDPIHMYLRSESHIVMQITDTLLRYDPLTNRAEAHLAHHIESSEDGRIWTFYLRKGVQFHDGKELDAKDVVYTFQRVKRENSPYRWMTELIEEMEVMDAYTLRIQLAYPCYWFDRFVCSPHLSILQEHASRRYQMNGRDKLIGTGPFRLVRNDESMLVLEAFPSYFRERALLDRIEIWIVPEHEDVIDREKNSYDLQYVPSADQAVSCQDTRQAGTQADRRTERMECNITYLSFQQMREGVLSSPYFRQALSLILHAKHMISDLGGERAEATDRFFLLDLRGGNRTEEGIVTRGNEKEMTELAQSVGQLLLQSNYQGETLRLFTFKEKDHRQDGEWIKARCAQYGVKLEVYHFTTEELLKTERVREADLIHDSATIGEDVELSLLHLFLSTNSFLYQHCNEEQREFVQQIAQKLCRTKDRRERYEMWEEAERHLLAEYGYLPLYRNQITMLSQPELKGVTINAQGWVDYYQLWMKKRC